MRASTASRAGDPSAQEFPASGKEAAAFHVARAAERAGLGLCVWRDYETYPHLSGFDLDVLMPPQPWGGVERFLRAESEAIGWTLLMCVRRGHLCTCLLARPGAEIGQDEDFLQIDLHTSLTVRGFPYANAADLRRRAVVGDGIRWLNRTDAAVVSWLEPLLAGARPKPAYTAGWERALREDPERVRQILREALGASLSSRLEAGEAERIAARRLRRALRLRALLGRPGETLRVLGLKTAHALLRYVRPPGALWSFSGPDGAGKSTLLERLVRLVDRRLAIGVTSFHTRPYLIPRLASVVPVRRERRAAILAQRGYEQGLGKTKSVARWIVLIADYLLGYWLRVRPLLAAGRLVVFDRYAHDYLVDPRIRGIDLPAAWLEACRRWVPKPQVRVYVLARPETLRRRKADLGEGEAAAQAAAYRELAAADAGGVVIDTDHRNLESAACGLASLLMARPRRKARPSSSLNDPEIRVLYRERVLPIYGHPSEPLYKQMDEGLDRLLYYCDLARIDEIAARGGWVLDLGAGVAAFGPLLRALGARVTLVDDFRGGGCVDPADPEPAQAILSRMRERLGIEVVEQDLLKGPLPATDSSVDAVVSFHCFEHLHHSPRFLMNEVRRVLRPGGCFVIGTPNAVNLRKRVSVMFGRTNLGDLEEWYYDGTPYRGHVREPVVRDLVRICEWGGLRVERVAGANFLGHHSRSYARMPGWLRPGASLLMRHMLPLWPGLCSDIHVVAVKPAEGTP